MRLIQESIKERHNSRMQPPGGVTAFQSPAPPQNLWAVGGQESSELDVEVALSDSPRGAKSEIESDWSASPIVGACGAVEKRSFSKGLRSNPGRSTVHSRDSLTHRFCGGTLFPVEPARVYKAIVCPASELAAWSDQSR